MDPTLRKTIIAAYNLGGLSEAEQNDTIERIGGLIFQSVLIKAMETMDDTMQKAFEKMLDNDASPEELMEYLRTNVENFDAMAKEEAERFQQESMDVMSQIGN
jgi:cyclopropane fatty-acyl-phospholipid synthase-like methyltransferase